MMKVVGCVFVLMGVVKGGAKSFSVVGASLLAIGAMTVSGLCGGYSTSYWGFSDVLSGCLVTLVLWIGGLMFLASDRLRGGESMFVVVVLLLTIVLLLAFMARSFLSFYIFFEAALLPTLFLVLGWGYQPERVQAGAYLVLYTVGASLPLLVAIFQLMGERGEGSFLLYSWEVSSACGVIGWWVMSMGAFLVKTPLYSFHLWLPKAHVEAPVAGSMVLAGVLLKLGGYGMLRVSEHVSVANLSVLPVVGSVGIYGGCIAGIICLRQTDLKSLIAYSSVAHMGLVVVGVLSGSLWGWVGALVMMLAHGLVSSALFALANICYQSIHSRSLYLVKGVLSVSPLLSLLWFFSLAANMGAPPTINLQGELMLALSAMGSGMALLVPVSLGLFFSAVYCFHLFVSVNHGEYSWGHAGFLGLSSRAAVCIILHLIPAYVGISKAELGCWF